MNIELGWAVEAAVILWSGALVIGAVWPILEFFLERRRRRRREP